MARIYMRKLVPFMVHLQLSSETVFAVFDVEINANIKNGLASLCGCTAQLRLPRSAITYAPAQASLFKNIIGTILIKPVLC